MCLSTLPTQEILLIMTVCYPVVHTSVMFTIRVTDRVIEGRKKLVIEEGCIYVDHQLIRVSTKEIIVTGDVGNFESDDSIKVIPGDDKTWIARRTNR